MKINYPDNEEFFSLGFYVDSRVLIPRNDTEVLVEKAIKEFAPPKTHSAEGEAKYEQGEFTLIDVGTGSSAIITSILKNIPPLAKVRLGGVFALDISEDALEVAKINIEKHGLQDKVVLLKSDLLGIFLEPLPTSPCQGRSFFPLIRGIEGVSTLIITANLPYIKNGDFVNIDKEVLDNEPHIALFGGEKTGFELYEKLISQIFELKKMSRLDIILFIEIGFDQYEYSKDYLTNLGLEFEYFKDLGGIWRCVKIKF